MMEDPGIEILSLQEDEGKEIVTTLSSEPTLEVYNRIQEEPSTPADIAEDLDIATQSVHYHIRKARDAGLINWEQMEYSEKGVEMKVYTPAVGNLIICDGPETRKLLNCILANYRIGEEISNFPP